MPVPKKRVSRSHSGQRRAHDHLVITAAVEPCPDCGAPRLRHHVCPACGKYRGRQVTAPPEAAEEAPAAE
jgi:large subunit ribosomal protein L32